MEKTRKENEKKKPKKQKVQKKAPIENKEAKNDDHIDDSNPKILPIISQQAVKKNGEVKTILKLAENKKAENTDLDVKKNEEAKIILERAEIRGNEEENSGEHEEENSGEHEVVLNQVGGPVAEVIGESIGESIDDASDKVGKAVAVMKKKITTLKKKMKHKK